MGNYLDNWLESVDYEQLKKKIDSRKVFIWGAFSNGKKVRNELENRGIYIYGYIDSHKGESLYDNLPIYKIENISETDSFVIVAVEGVRKPIVDSLQKCFKGNENVQWVYIFKLIPKITLVELSGYYEDIYGNKIFIEDENLKCRVELLGWNNVVEIGKNFQAMGTIRISFGGNVQIGNNVMLDKDTEINASNGGKVYLGESCNCAKESRIITQGAKIEIERCTSMGYRFYCLAGSNSYIKIGEDGMISHDVSVLATGGHSILDLERKENISKEGEEYCIIGRHVWIGKGATIMYNARIGEGSIIGANSLVKLKCDKNCIIGGNPGKVIRENATWDRRMNVDFEDVF